MKTELTKSTVYQNPGTGASVILQSGKAKEDTVNIESVRLYAEAARQQIDLIRAHGLYVTGKECGEKLRHYYGRRTNRNEENHRRRKCHFAQI